MQSRRRPNGLQRLIRVQSSPLQKRYRASDNLSSNLGLWKVKGVISFTGTTGVTMGSLGARSMVWGPAYTLE